MFKSVHSKKNKIYRKLFDKSEDAAPVVEGSGHKESKRENPVYADWNYLWALYFPHSSSKSVYSLDQNNQQSGDCGNQRQIANSESATASNNTPNISWDTKKNLKDRRLYPLRRSSSGGAITDRADKNLSSSVPRQWLLPRNIPISTLLISVSNTSALNASNPDSVEINNSDIVTTTDRVQTRKRDDGKLHRPVCIDVSLRGDSASLRANIGHGRVEESSHVDDSSRCSTAGRISGRQRRFSFINRSPSKPNSNKETLNCNSDPSFYAKMKNKAKFSGKEAKKAVKGGGRSGPEKVSSSPSKWGATVPTDDFAWEAAGSNSIAVSSPNNRRQTTVSHVELPHDGCQQTRSYPPVNENVNPDQLFKPIPENCQRQQSFDVRIDKKTGHKGLGSLPNLVVAQMRKFSIGKGNSDKSHEKSKRNSISCSMSSDQFQPVTGWNGGVNLGNQSNHSFSNNDVSQLYGPSAFKPFERQQNVEAATAGVCIGQEHFRVPLRNRANNVNRNESHKRYSWAGGDRQPECPRYESDRFRRSIMSHSPINEDESEAPPLSPPRESVTVMDYNSQQVTQQLRNSYAMPPSVQYQSQSHSQYNQQQPQQHWVSQRHSMHENNLNLAPQNYPNPQAYQRPQPPVVIKTPQYSTSNAEANDLYAMVSTLENSQQMTLDNNQNSIDSFSTKTSPGSGSNQSGAATSSAYSSCVGTGDARDLNVNPARNVLHGNGDWNNERAVIVKMYEDKLSAAEKRCRDLELYYQDMFKDQQQRSSSNSEVLMRRETELTAAQNTIRNLSNIIASKDSQMLSLRDQVSYLNRDLNQKCNVISQLQQRLNQLQSANEGFKAKTLKLEEELRKSEEDRLRLKEEIGQLRVPRSVSSSKNECGNNKWDPVVRKCNLPRCDCSQSHVSLEQPQQNQPQKIPNVNLSQNNCDHSWSSSNPASGPGRLQGCSEQGNEGLVQSLSGKVKQLEKSLAKMEQERQQQSSVYERERMCWLEEKEIVLRYQKQLQANYTHVDNVNKILQKQINKQQNHF